jgi:hypothetical protein
MVAWKRLLILFGGFHESTRLVPTAEKSTFSWSDWMNFLWEAILNVHGKHCPLKPRPASWAHSLAATAQLQNHDFVVH